MSYSIRPCHSHDELGACAALQKQIWGYADYEVYPLRLFINLTKIGGHVLGAFTPEGQLVGFVASMPAWHGRRRYYHSLSLGVLPDHENKGLGKSLKLTQREEAIRHGLNCIEWSFDPLKAKNAFFNLERLGAVARRYLADHYGPVESKLQQGLPTDRLIAEWWLESPRVMRVLSGKPARPEGQKIATQVSWISTVGQVAESNPGRARAIQQAVREQLQKLFADKLVITGFVKGEMENRYLLNPETEAELSAGDLEWRRKNASDYSSHED
jgi:predicted GNAT superfamily acetyltransferase